jgi:hypothetical protein
MLAKRKNLREYASVRLQERYGLEDRVRQQLQNGSKSVASFTDFASLNEGTGKFARRNRQDFAPSQAREHLGFTSKCAAVR